MSYATNSSGTCSGKRPQTKTAKQPSKRSPSANEIAKNKAYFETWCHHQNLEQTSYKDIPEDLKADIEQVFNVSQKIPLGWVTKKSKQYKLLKKIATPDFLTFVRQAHKENEELFYEEENDDEAFGPLFMDISMVYSCWEALAKKRKSKENWSEADYGANVYTPVRRAGLKESTKRNQCRVCLPQHLVLEKMGSESRRILGARMVIPDCAVFVPEHLVAKLSDSEDSAFKKLKRHESAHNTGEPTRQSSFPYQCTPCFEFASSFSEDKKPSHQILEDAYRQNRMSTASAVRHLHSLHVNAPVFGLVWSDNHVRAHVDWWKITNDEQLIVYSAPYMEEEARKEKEWELHKPSDLLEVFLILRNIDRFTTGPFVEKVEKGMHINLGGSP
ncbi:hypothetical protein K435DRAFT_789742 [Dendrothele bispora CBS 962.96]|uniref:Uncharacterized protein n=1 Tax=Dendrothele bispora (strain CBS 962.96) TaxID=1314807 RepID=A0A4S8MUB5_DENBC|nr:hypothetical protein K435DRAFT_789742 [Dendrothele bispora CBS 962.96]